MTMTNPPDEKIPNLHNSMINAAVAVTLLSMGLYALVPAPKDEMFKMLAVMGFSFLTGKFTNNFGGKNRQGKDT